MTQASLSSREAMGIKHSVLLAGTLDQVQQIGKDEVPVALAKAASMRASKHEAGVIGRY